MATTPPKTRRNAQAGSPASDAAAPDAAVKKRAAPGAAVKKRAAPGAAVKKPAARSSAGAAAKKAATNKPAATKAASIPPAGTKPAAKKAPGRTAATRAAAVPLTEAPTSAEASVGTPPAAPPKARKTAAAPSALAMTVAAPTGRGRPTAAEPVDSPLAEAAPAETAPAPAAKSTASKPGAGKPAASKKAAAKKAAAKKAAAKKTPVKPAASKKAAAKKAAAKKAEATTPVRATPQAGPAPAVAEASPALAEANANSAAVAPAIATIAESAAPVVDEPVLPVVLAPGAAPEVDEGPAQAAAEPAGAGSGAAGEDADSAAPVDAGATESGSAAAPGGQPDQTGRRRERGGRGRRGGRRDERGEGTQGSQGIQGTEGAERGHRGHRAPRAEPAPTADRGPQATPAAADQPETHADLVAEQPTADDHGARSDGAPPPSAPQAGPAPIPAPPPPPPAPVVRAPTSGPQHSRITLSDGDERLIVWQPGQACPQPLLDAGHARAGESGQLRPDDDGALPLLLRLAAEGGHRLDVQPEVWPLLAANRDARTRLHVLAAAYPEGPSSPALAGLLSQPLPLYQAEGALFAVVAGRALIADERGLGKGVQAMAALQLWRRHFGLQRVALLCAPGQRAAWQRALRRFAGLDAQVMDGGLHHRQSLWSSAAELRILSPDALASDAAHLAQWAPELVIVDEPQHLDGWTTLAAPQALVLCGAPLDAQPALLDVIVDWLDSERQGPLAALRQVQQARQLGRGLDEQQIEQITDTLSRLMLQRQRSEVADQLPALVVSERLVPLGPAQREAHDRALATVRQLVRGWQRSGYLADANQWRLGQAVRAAQQACHRADPSDSNSPLAEATVRALAAQLADWAATGQPNVAMCCASEADRVQLQDHLQNPNAQNQNAQRGPSPDAYEAYQPYPRLALLAPGEDLPPDTDVVLRVGAPWRMPRPADGQARGQQWLSLVGQHSLDCALADTLAQRGDAPRSLADGGRGYLTGGRLVAWLQALQQALAALDASAAPEATPGG